MSTTTRDEILAVEQKAVDHAYDCYTARLVELTGQSVASASASGKDSIANWIEAEEQAAAYGGLGAESLVISRVDVQDGPGEGPGIWYVELRHLVIGETPQRYGHIVIDEAQNLTPSRLARCAAAAR